MLCIHCSEEIASLNDASQHPCLIGKNIFIGDQNNLFARTENKQPAVWDKNAILALLSLYEAKIDTLDHPKKKTKIWESISTDLQQDFGIQMSMDQVRWKINALIKKYKECVDNNSRSGRAPMTFEWFNQLEEIFGQQRDATAQHTVLSKFMHLTSEPSTSSARPSISSARPISLAKPTSLSTFDSINISTSSISSDKTSDNLDILQNESSQNLKDSQNIANPTLSITKRKRPLHGSGSNLARTKIALENQWLTYLKTKDERDKINDERYASTLEQKKEMIKLKKKHLALKEKEVEQQKEYFIARLKGKENRHTERIAIEKEKCKLLKKLLKTSEKNTEASDSEY